MTAFNLRKTFIVVDPALNAHQRPVTETFYPDLERDYSAFAGHSLISCYRFTSDWETWECHPAGDEVVCLISGQATLLLQTEQGQQSVELLTSGDTVVIPQNTWHTARVDQACEMIFMTPGEGTRNAAQPPDAERR